METCVFIMGDTVEESLAKENKWRIGWNLWSLFLSRLFLFLLLCHVARLCLVGFLLIVHRSSLVRATVVVHLVDVLVDHVLKALLLEQVDVAETTRVRITVRGMVDGTLAELHGFFVREVHSPVVVEHTVGVRGTGTDRELGHLVTRAHTRAFVVNVVQHGLAIVVAHHHHTNRHAVALVVIGRIGNELGRRAHRDAMTVAELVHAALHGQVALPVLTIRGRTRQRGEDVFVDWVDLLDLARGNERTLRRARVDGHTDAALVDERERGRTLLELERLLVVLAVLGLEVRARILGWIRHRRQHEARGELVVLEVQRRVNGVHGRRKGQVHAWHGASV